MPRFPKGKGGKRRTSRSPPMSETAAKKGAHDDDDGAQQVTRLVGCREALGCSGRRGLHTYAGARSCAC